MLRRFHLVTVQQVLRWLFTKSLERLVKEVAHEGALCFSFWKKPQKTKRIAAHTSIPASLFSDLGQFFFLLLYPQGLTLLNPSVAQLSLEKLL